VRPTFKGTRNAREPTVRQTATDTTTYTYNVLGQRIKKINQNGLATSFHYGPDGELLFEVDQAGNTKAYVWLNGRPLARIDNNQQIYYYHVDHLGTVLSMTDATTGAVVWKGYYEPFGSATVRPVSTIENNLRLPGQYYDRETGLHYNYFRDYDPSTGRYVEADPIGLNAGPNVYAYVEGKPLTQIDPFGLANGPAVGWMHLSSKRSRCVRGPDFLNFQIDAYVFSAWGTFTRDRNSFVGGGFNKTYPSPVSLTANVTAGWLNTSSVQPGQTNSFVNGFSGGGAAAYVGMGGGLLYSPGNGTATVLGIGVGYAVPASSITGAVGGGISVDQGKTGLGWGSGPACGCQ